MSTVLFRGSRSSNEVCIDGWTSRHNSTTERLTFGLPFTLGVSALQLISHLTNNTTTTMNRLPSRQVFFPFFLSTCATVALASAVFHCNLLEVSEGSQKISGASIGLWQTSEELNFELAGEADPNVRYKCVPWTKDQERTFDSWWNHGRVSGFLTFFLGVFATLLLGAFSCTKLPKCLKTALGCLQFFVAVQSAMLLLVLESTICEEFSCFLGIGGLLAIAASVMFFVVSFNTLSLDYNQQQVPSQDGLAKAESFTERMDRSELGLTLE